MRCIYLIVNVFHNELKGVKNSVKYIFRAGKDRPGIPRYDVWKRLSRAFQNIGAESLHLVKIAFPFTGVAAWNLYL